MPRAKRTVKDGYNTLFAKRLRRLIEEKGITQNQLAEIIGKTRQTINGYTLGNAAPDSDTLIKLCEYFNVSADYLLGLSDVVTVDKDIKFISDYIGLDETVIDNLHSNVGVYKDLKKMFSNKEIYTDYSSITPSNYFALNDLIEHMSLKSFSQLICETVALMLKIDKMKKDNYVTVDGFVDFYTKEPVYRCDECTEKQINELEEKKSYLMFKISSEMQRIVKEIYLHYQNELND